MVVSWLPLYHDMGLIGCAFTPPLTGTPLWLLPPDLRNPRLWLELLTRVRATFTVSPDFGYRNCVRNVQRHRRSRPHEPQVRALRRRAGAALAPSRPSSGTSALKRVITPCYGLAEATLAVAIWPRGVPLRLDASGRFLSVGQPCPGVSVRIVEPRDEHAADGALEAPWCSRPASRARSA